MMGVEIIAGDCREELRKMDADSVHCVVTSPPYFGLRDYGCAGQIGLEATPDAYVAEMVAVFREVRRVLRADGTFWLNLGDSYAAQGGRQVAQSKWKVEGASDGQNSGESRRPPPGAKPKDRLMIPARVALALQADGWWLRDEIIWHKPNPMPVSVTDRTTPAHEMLYMFSKSARYHYDMDAVKEPAVYDEKRTGRVGAYQIRAINHVGDGTTPTGIATRDTSKRQPRSVWTITPKPFKGAHFAAFPPALVEKMILAGCPVGGTVLDPFGGSGTTGAVANQLGRNAILIELNQEYVEMARERINGPLFAGAK